MIKYDQNSELIETVETLETRDNDRKLKEICMHEKFWQFLNNSTFITPIYPPSPEIMQTQLHMHLIQTQPFRISCPLPPDSPNSYIDDTSVNYVDPEYLWCVLIILLDAIKHTYDNKLIILQEYMQTNQKI